MNGLTVKGDPWDAARDAFYPDFDCATAVAPAAVLQSSVCPGAPLVLLMSTPDVRAPTAEWNLLRENKR